MSRKRKILLVLLIVIPLLIGLYFLFREGPAGVSVFTVKRGDVEATVTATTTGTVMAKAISEISSQYAGRIERILKREGERVKRDEVILELENEDAKAQVNLAAANLKALEAELNQILISRDVTISQTSAMLSQTIVKLNNARSSFERVSSLYSKGSVSKQEMDNARASMDVADADYENAKANKLQERIKDEEIKMASARVEQMESNLQLARVQLNRTFITAPYSGVITDRFVEEGELLSIGKTVCEIADDSEMEVEAAVDEVDAGKIHIGQEVRLSFDAVKDKIFKGRIKEISPLVTTTEEQNRTVDIKVRINTGENRVKVGMSTDVEVIIDIVKGALYIPTNSIIERADGQFVLIAENGILKEGKVKTGLSNWNTTEITEGLKEGDEVITSLDIKGLRDGQRVKVIKKE